jgi:hypothetical protein
MNCHELAKRLSELDPSMRQVDVARLSLMILSQATDVTALSNTDALVSAWRNATFRLESAADQHAAVADELEAICEAGTVQFTADQVCALLRAVKVQSQILELYTDPPVVA